MITIAACFSFVTRRFLPLLVAVLAGCTAVDAPAADDGATYELVYTIDLAHYDDAARASIRIGDNARVFRELRMDFDPERLSEFEADGELEVEDDKLTWRPPRDGGALSYRALIEHRRRNGDFDARRTERWALFRGDDLFPPATTRVVEGARSEARIEFQLPEEWSVATRWQDLTEDDEQPVRDPERRFVRPTGWIIAGNIGVRRDDIGGVKVAIAAPVEQDFRRMDIMAFLTWTLPAVVEVFPTMDETLLIVGANDPMWRGGLSGPGSLYVHADRPLISENGTSTFLHEVVHVAMGAAGSENEDWLLEGLAEYYSVALLARTGTLSENRRRISMDFLDDWGKDVDDLFTRNSTGERTARAAVLLAALDEELRDSYPDGAGLDDLVADIIEREAAWNYSNLCEAVDNVFGQPAKTLDPSVVPGAPELEECGGDD